MAVTNTELFRADSLVKDKEVLESLPVTKILSVSSINQRAKGTSNPVSELLSDSIINLEEVTR